MDTVPWRRQAGGLDRPPPGEPMYIPVLRGSSVSALDHEFVNEKYMRQCISIQETIAKEREISNKIKAEKAQIQLERCIKKMAGLKCQDDSDEEPWKNHMDDKHKCLACKKPFWEWRLGQQKCELCQLHEGWKKGFDTKEEKLQQRTAQPEAKPAAAERTAQPKAKPKAKPVHLMPEPWGPKGYSKGKQYRRLVVASERHIG